MLQKRNRAQWWEDSYPTVLSLALLAIGLIFLWRYTPWLVPVLDGIGRLVPSALNVSAIAVGFLATAEAILLSLGESRALRALKESGHYGRLVGFFTRALAASFTSALLSALLTAMRLSLGGFIRYACVLAWAFFGLTSLLCYYRASQMLSYVLRTNSEPSTPSNTGKVTDRRHNDVEILDD